MARTAPVLGSSTPELHSADLPIRALEPIVDTEDRAAEVIVAVDPVLNSGYAAELAFMEEEVTVIVHRQREKSSPAIFDFTVQGRPIWVAVDTPTIIKRKYLEVIARSQPYDVTTEVNRNEDKGENAVVQNILHRHKSAHYPFTVVSDKNPRGGAWLAKVMRES